MQHTHGANPNLIQKMGLSQDHTAGWGGGAQVLGTDLGILRPVGLSDPFAVPVRPVEQGQKPWQQPHNSPSFPGILLGKLLPPLSLEGPLCVTGTPPLGRAVFPTDALAG